MRGPVRGGGGRERGVVAGHERRRRGGGGGAAVVHGHANGPADEPLLPGRDELPGTPAPTSADDAVCTAMTSRGSLTRSLVDDVTVTSLQVSTDFYYGRSWDVGVS